MTFSAKPKIAYVLPRFDPSTGSHFFHLYELLREAGRTLDILVIAERGEAPEGLGVPARRLTFSWPPLRLVELTLRLGRERFRGRRLVYVHYSFVGAIAAWIATRFGGRVLYWNCGMPWLYRRPRFEEAVFRFVLARTELVTGTPGLAAEYARRYDLKSHRVHVMPNWANIRRFSSGPDRASARSTLGLPAEAKVILFVHRLSRRKGAHLLPDIIAGVTKQRPDAIFLIVGDGPERERVKLEVKSLQLEPYARIVGEVPHRDIPPYYRAADALVMPSEEEGFPHVILEAMASGLPYVSSDVGGVREITPPELQPYIVSNLGSAPFIPKALDLLALPTAERTSISAAERQWVKRYGLYAILPEFVKLFQP